jgi:hypothetical protein
LVFVLLDPLLGDNFVAVQDYFNAKHSLQSIVDNYDGTSKAELVKMAQDKIDEILVLEAAEKNQFEEQDVEIDFENSDPKDQELFEEENGLNNEQESPNEGSNIEDNEK